MKVNQLDGTVIDAVHLSSISSQTIHTHKSVTVPAGSSSYGDSGWIDTCGYSKIAVTMISDASAPNFIYLVWSHDQSNNQGGETLVPTASSNLRSGITETKARYCRVQVKNEDTEPHTMSAWAYLKV